VRVVLLSAIVVQLLALGTFSAALMHLLRPVPTLKWMQRKHATAIGSLHNMTVLRH
jgi:hypothetical protein